MCWLKWNFRSLELLEAPGTPGINANGSGPSARTTRSGGYFHGTVSRSLLVFEPNPTTRDAYGVNNSFPDAKQGRALPRCHRLSGDSDRVRSRRQRTRCWTRTNDGHWCCLYTRRTAGVHCVLMLALQCGTIPYYSLARLQAT